MRACAEERMARGRWRQRMKGERAMTIDEPVHLQSRRGCASCSKTPQGRWWIRGGRWAWLQDGHWQATSRDQHFHLQSLSSMYRISLKQFQGWNEPPKLVFVPPQCPSPNFPCPLHIRRPALCSLSSPGTGPPPLGCHARGCRHERRLSRLARRRCVMNSQRGNWLWWRTSWMSAGERREVGRCGGGCLRRESLSKMQTCC